jgi:hypothetical protein
MSPAGGYAVGSAVLDAVLPPHDVPTATVPVTMSDIGLEERDGIEAKTASWNSSQPPCRSSAITPRRASRPSGANARWVGFTIAEFIPRQVMHLQQLLSGFPLISETAG